MLVCLLTTRGNLLYLYYKVLFILFYFSSFFIFYYFFGIEVEVPMYFTDYCEYSCLMSISKIEKFIEHKCTLATEVNPFRSPFETLVPSLNVPYHVFFIFFFLPFSFSLFSFFFFLSTMFRLLHKDILVMVFFMDSKCNNKS